MQKLKNVIKSIDVEFTDIKAEVVIADIREHQIDFNNIEVKFDGAFERNYKKDINSLRVDMVKQAISLHLTRNSLYDVLPEGLFHPVSRYGGLDAKELKAEFKKQKQEEEKARRFFQPFDQEFLLQRVQLELSVRNLFENPMSVFESLFPNRTGIPQKFYRQLLKYLPFTNYFKGNAELTAQCLAEIVDENVRVNSYYTTLFTRGKHSSEYSGLGTVNLGENFICGDGLNENVPVWEFIIEIKEETKLEELIGTDRGPVLTELMDRFSAFFVPFEVVVKTKVVCPDQRPLVLGREKEFQGEEAEQPAGNFYLGYNTSI